MYVWYIHTYLLIYYIWNCRPEIVSFFAVTFAFSFNLSENAQKYAMEKAMATGNAISNANKPRVSLYVWVCVCGITRSVLWYKSCQLENCTFCKSVKRHKQKHTHAHTHGALRCVCLWLQLSQLLPFICAYQRVKCAIQMQMRSVIKNVQMPA